MLILQLGIILFFAFILRYIYIYLDNNLKRLGNQNIITQIIMWIMILNICLMMGIFIFASYYTEWTNVGRAGLQGPDGPEGDVGNIGCNKNTNTIKC
jgi:hypothetical protein